MCAFAMIAPLIFLILPLFFGFIACFGCLLKPPNCLFFIVHSPAICVLCKSDSMYR